MYRNQVKQPRPKANFDGQLLNGSQIFANQQTILNQGSTLMFVDCSNTSGGLASNRLETAIGQLQGIAAFYNEYVYESLVVEWLPLIAPGTADAGTRVYIGYVDNPEVIATLTAASAPTTVGAVKGIRNFKAFNAWEHFRYSVPLTRRVKAFNVNTVTVHTDAEINGRSCQGAVVMGLDSLTAAGTYGAWRTYYTVRLKGLQTQVAT
jgi:hypothetical protein